LRSIIADRGDDIAERIEVEIVNGLGEGRLVHRIFLHENGFWSWSSVLVPNFPSKYRE
jgi:hypothetical protein